MIEVHAILFLLPLGHYLLLYFFLVLDALNEVGQSGRSGMEIVLAGLHIVSTLDFPLGALRHRLSIRGQSLVMRRKVVPLSRLDQNRIICILFLSAVIEANGFAAEGGGRGLGAHRDECTLLVWLLPGEAIVEDLLPRVCQLIRSHSLI